MSVSIQWNPDKAIQDRLNALAERRGESPEEIITEAVQQYLELEIIDYKKDQDTLIGLFSSSEHLAYRSEEIIRREIRDQSGWSWKENSS